MIAGKLLFTISLFISSMVFSATLLVAQTAGGTGTPRAGFWQIYRDGIESSFLQEQVVEPDEDKVLRQYRYALDTFNRFRYLEALQAFERLSLEFPGTPWAKRSLFRMGEIYEKIDQDEKAIGEYRKVLGIYADTVLDDLALYRIGSIYRRRSAPSEKLKAIETYLELINSYPNSIYVARSNFHIAESYWSMGIWGEAERFFRVVTRMHGDAKWESGVSLANEAEIYQDVSRYLNRSHDEEKGYLNLRRQLAAIENYSRALQLSPSESSRGLIYLRIAQAYEKIGWEKEAIDNYLKAGEDKGSPFSDYAIFRISEIHYNKSNVGDVGENRRMALESFGNFISQYPESRYVPVAMGRVDSLQRARQADSKNPNGEVFKDYPILYRYQKALIEYSRLLKDYPDDRLVHQVYPHIVEALTYLELWNDAKEIYFSRVQGSGKVNGNRGFDQGTPILSLSMMGIADLLSNPSNPERDVEKAIIAYRKLSDLFVGSPMASQAFYKIGKLYEDAGLWKDALSAFWESTSQGQYSPWSDSALFAIGNLYQKGRIPQPEGKVLSSEKTNSEVAKDSTSQNDEVSPLLLSDQERNEIALSIFSSLLDAYPESHLSPQAVFRSGKLLASLGRVPKARERLELVISKHSGERGENGHKLAIDARVELDLLKGIR